MYGLAGFGALTLAGGNALGLRAEILDMDAPGDRTLWGLTATYELRHDRADDPFFAGKNGALKKNQTTLTIGQAYSF